MAVVLQPDGKAKQFRTNAYDTIRYVPEVRDTFYFLCSGSLEFSLCSTLGHVYITWKKALSVAFFKWWRQLNLLISNRTLGRLLHLMLSFYGTHKTSFLIGSQKGNNSFENYRSYFKLIGIENFLFTMCYYKSPTCTNLVSPFEVDNVMILILQYKRIGEHIT